MPPFGLYPVPRHHQYHASPFIPRPTFNTLNFDNERPEPKSEPVAETQTKSKKRREKRKEKARQSRISDTQQDGAMQVDAAPESTTPIVNKEENNKKKKPKEERSSNGTSAKKRKRESGAHIEAQVNPQPEQGKNTPLLHANFLESLKTTMGDLSAAFNSAAKPDNTPQPVLKKQKKTVDVGAATPFKRPTEYDEHGNKTPKKRGRPSKEEVEGTNNGVLENAHKAMDPTVRHENAGVTAVDSPSVNSVFKATPKTQPGPMRFKTPVPLPQKSSLSEFTPSRNQQTAAKAQQKTSQILVAETPPSKPQQILSVDRRPSIPFELAPKPSSTQDTVHKKFKKKHATDTVPSSTGKEVQQPASAPPGPSKSYTGPKDTFTSITLMQYKQPLADPATKRQSKNLQRSLSSTSLSSLSASIKDYYPPVTKSHALSIPPPNPFITSKSTKTKKSQPNKTYPEDGATMSSTAAFHHSQPAIIFINELNYLISYTKWKQAYTTSGPLLCLHLSTGCNTKREQILALSKEDSASSALTISLADMPAVDTSGVNTAIAAANHASNFLRSAVHAKVPVPLGAIEGAWKLYCPKYTETHMDRYAAGLRTLSITALARGGGGGGPEAQYAARLSIPPRSMPFTLSPFRAAPHASFRTVSVYTVKERYEMQLVLLGNGYLSLKVDLHLLLVGKASESEKGVMEFLGVHEKAVAWEGGGDV